jgi:tripartite-type tricarboxylate transporter receptor subunit TctC
MGLPPSLQHVKAGKLRAIAVTGLTRSPLLPAVPTVSESGLSGFNVSSWYGVFAPAGLPRNLVTKLNIDIASLLAAADVKERLASLGAEPMPLPPEDFGRYVRAEIEKWAKAVAESGVKVD